MKQPSLLFRDQMDKFQCADQHCPHSPEEHEALVMRSKCCDSDHTRATYEYGGVLLIECAHCSKPIIRIAVALEGSPVGA